METLKPNRFIADRLREAAALLEQQGANRYRVAAYTKAADTIDALAQDVTVLFRADGFPGLTSLPGIGPQIAGAIAEIIRTGRWIQLERLRGATDPEWLFSQVPGIGVHLADRVVDALHIDTLEALEIAVYDGRLGQVPGFGHRRVAMVRAALAEMLVRRRRTVQQEPSVDILLDVDREYREKSAAKALHRIAPRRFNPTGEAWLPILHTERGRWRFTVMYSNTANAHSLGRTRDWVVIYFHTDSHSEGQRTVVTETQGPLKGARVVRGRESECNAKQPMLWSESSNAA
jgi:hypothetical protein